MEREEELKKYLCTEENKVLTEPIISEFAFLEERLGQLKQLPFIQVKKDDQSKQRATPAAKMYKELLQQYTNIMKVLQKYDNSEGAEEESPLRKWVKKHANTE